MKIYRLHGPNKITSVRRQESLNSEIDQSTQGKTLCKLSPKGLRHISKAELKQQMNIMVFKLLYHRQNL